MIYALVINKDYHEEKSNDFNNFSGMSIDKYLYAENLNQDILQQLSPTDMLVVEDISLLGKNLNEIVNALNLAAQYKINLHLIRENLFFKTDRLSEIASSLLLAFRLHQSLISLRSQSALQGRKTKGLKLGRPLGFSPDLKLDDHKEEIKELVLAGVSKDDTALKIFFFDNCRLVNSDFA